MEKVIYTAIMGVYDQLKDPTVITPGWHYICYTNNRDLKSNIWEIVFVNFQNVKQVRRHKIIVPFQYQLSIWVDASIEIRCDLNDFVAKYHTSNFTLMKHPHRSCVYAEAEACIVRKKDKAEVIHTQMKTYRKLKYPYNRGMVATGLLIRNHCQEVVMFCERWWNEVNIHSKRDQLSFNFTTFINPIKYNLISFDVLQDEFKLHLHHIQNKVL